MRKCGDLRRYDTKEAEKLIKGFENKTYKNITRTQNKTLEYTGKILHLDGDKRYSEKSTMYYKKMGLNAVVRNIPENKQPKAVYRLLQIYNPDILVITRT